MNGPQRYNTIRCPRCRRRVLTIGTMTAEVMLAEKATVLDGPAGQLGNWLVACPRDHRFRVSEGITAG